MPRPLPNIPRGPRRGPAAVAEYLLACPRISPQWELGALQALLKPQTKGAILHRKATQAWPAAATRAVQDVRQLVRDALGFDAQPHFAAEGDYHFLIRAPAVELEALKAFGLLVSQKVRGPWFVLGRLFLHRGQFYRRKRGHKLNLVVASNVHLSRGVWAALHQAKRDAKLELASGE